MKNKNLLWLIHEILNPLTKTKYLIKLNIVVVYNKIRKGQNEKWKTVFRIKYGFFETLIIKFGFCGTQSALLNYINDILHEYLTIFFVLRISMTFSFMIKKKKKRETHSVGVPKNSKNWVTIGYRQMRILCSGNQILKFNNQTRKH